MNLFCHFVNFNVGAILFHFVFKKRQESALLSNENQLALKKVLTEKVRCNFTYNRFIVALIST